MQAILINVLYTYQTIFITILLSLAQDRCVLFRSAKTRICRIFFLKSQIAIKTQLLVIVIIDFSVLKSLKAVEYRDTNASGYSQLSF